MNGEDISDLLQSIADNHAMDSDFDGDSDADDNFAVNIYSTDRSSILKIYNQSIMLIKMFLRFDSVLKLFLILLLTMFFLLCYV